MRIHRITGDPSRAKGELKLQRKLEQLREQFGAKSSG